MCCCEKPTINGEPGYRWNDERTGIHPVNPPEIEDGDVLLFDEPGRCGGVDSHSHHYRLVQAKYGGVALLVHHGGGDEKIPYLSNDRALVEALKSLDSNGRYWILGAIYHAQKTAKMFAKNEEAAKWRQAAAEKRIKTRKLPAQKQVKVWIEEVPNA